MALSKTQNRRLGAILSVMLDESPPEDAVQSIVSDGFAEKLDQRTVLTAKGLDEKNRLCTLAGLNIKYSSEKK